MVSSIVGDRSEAGARQRSPRLAAYGVAAAALVAAATIAVARPASIVDVATWSFILVAASIFPALVAALWCPRASAPGAAAAMLVGLAAALLYLLVPHCFPVPFFEATSALSNAGVSGQEYFAELKEAWLTAEPGAAKDTAWLALEAHARSLAGWWGIDKLGAALIAVPAGIVTLLLVSLVVPRRVADTAP
jgi:Na+(H+)/acetate symporter ActP